MGQGLCITNGVKLSNVPRTSLGCLLIAPVYINALWHIALKAGVMTGLSIELQLFMCDLSISCVSPESSEHPISSQCRRAPSFCNFQTSFPGEESQRCVYFHSFQSSVFSWRCSITNNKSFFPSGRLVFGCLTAWIQCGHIPG